MSLLNTPKGLRLHIGLFGKRNAGKSSLINALTNQTISIVSNVPGTTTDPVEKACEFLKDSKYPISQVSAEVGYSDHSYFCRVFKKITGKTPSAYRRENLWK